MVPATWPWLVAFAFGLLHGFGFADALSEVGLPQHVFFNLGVEVGQLAFVALVMALAWWLPGAKGHRLTPERAEEIGLIRIYGDPRETAQLRAIIASTTG